MNVNQAEPQALPDEERADRAASPFATSPSYVDPSPAGSVHDGVVRIPPSSKRGAPPAAGSAPAPSGPTGREGGYVTDLPSFAKRRRAEPEEPDEQDEPDETLGEADESEAEPATEPEAIE